MTTYDIATLTRDDAARYNAFLSEAVERHPDTLRIARDEIVTSPFSTNLTDDTITFVAKRGDEWLGVCSVERERGRAKRRHIAWIMRMYVAREAAGQGIGRALFRAALARACEMPGVAKVNLTVAAHNVNAIHLYESEGFTTFAREEDAFRDSQSRAELTMSRRV